MLDLNHNGIPDYQEPKVWLWLGGFIAFAVKALAAPHTIAYRAADAYQNAVAGLTPKEPSP